MRLLPPKSRRGGFSLIEAVVSVGVLAVAISRSRRAADWIWRRGQRIRQRVSRHSDVTADDTGFPTELFDDAGKRLAKRGLGLLIHDAYRPWHVTKMFWDATPEAQKLFVADPEQGSRHNRQRGSCPDHRAPAGWAGSTAGCGSDSDRGGPGARRGGNRHRFRCTTSPVTSAWTTSSEWSHGR